MYSSMNVVRAIKWTGHVARLGVVKAFLENIDWGDQKGKRPLGRPRRM